MKLHGCCKVQAHTVQSCAGPASVHNNAPIPWQVGIIRNVEVELGAKLRDQREAQTEEGAKLRKWQARLAAARKKLAEGAAEGASTPLGCVLGFIGFHHPAYEPSATTP